MMLDAGVIILDKNHRFPSARFGMLSASPPYKRLPMVAAALFTIIMLVASAVPPSLWLVDAGGVSELPDPPAAPPTPPADIAREMRQAGAGLDIAAVSDPHDVPNRVAELSATEVAELEANGATVVINEPGFVAYDLVVTGERLRVVQSNATTISGTEVIAFGVLGEDEIARLDAVEASSLRVGPEVAAAHSTNFGHKHNLPNWLGFYCSYIYEYPLRSGEAKAAYYVYICPSDVDRIRYIGYGIGQAGGDGSVRPLPWWLGGLGWNYGVGWLTESTGSVQIHVPSVARANYYGWHYFYGPEDWFYSFPSWDYLYGYARKYLNQKVYWIKTD